MSAAYPFPWQIGIPLFRDVLLGRRRAFRADAIACIQKLSPSPKLLQPEYIPARGPALLLTNHYTRPGFGSYWIALTISASMPMDVHWMMTGAWTFLGPLDRPTRGLFARFARVYGFTGAPPMPPDPNETAARARAVRAMLSYARQSADPVIALAPEGLDYPGGVLGPLPPGAGRFIHLLSVHCQPIVPIGVYEDEDGLCLSFGPAFALDVPAGCPPAERDAQVSQRVLTALAQQLPPDLRGAYA